MIDLKFVEIEKTLQENFLREEFILVFQFFCSVIQTSCPNLCCDLVDQPWLLDSQY